jgi:hypothetical protein
MLKILPESQGYILGVKVTGKFTGQDYKEFLIPRLKAMIQEYGRVRVLLHLDEDFLGWDLDALRQDGFGHRHKDDFQKIAVVGGSWWLSLEMKFMASLIAGEVRNFSRAELHEAWTWIRT